MKISINLFEIRLSEHEGYGLSILGYGLTGQSKAIGFNIRKQKQPEVDILYLIVYLYGLRYWIVLRSIPKSHCKCNYCGTPVYIGNGWCCKCREIMLESELTWVEVDEIKKPI